MEWKIIIKLKNGELYSLGFKDRRERNTEYSRIMQEVNHNKFVYFNDTSDNSKYNVSVDAVLAVVVNSKTISELKKLEELKQNGQQIS